MVGLIQIHVALAEAENRTLLHLGCVFISQIERKVRTANQWLIIIVSISQRLRS